MKRFWLDRHKDESGVSGTGRVAEGVVATGGKCILVWLGVTTSVVVYDSFEDMAAIHGHNGNTTVRWID